MAGEASTANTEGGDDGSQPDDESVTCSADYEWGHDIPLHLRPAAFDVDSPYLPRDLEALLLAKHDWLPNNPNNVPHGANKIFIFLSDIKHLRSCGEDDKTIEHFRVRCNDRNRDISATWSPGYMQPHELRQLLMAAIQIYIRYEEQTCTFLTWIGAVLWGQAAKRKMYKKLVVNPQAASRRGQEGPIVGQGHGGGQQDTEALIDTTDALEEDEAQQIADGDEAGFAETAEGVEEGEGDYSYRDFLSDDLRDDIFFSDDIFTLEDNVSGEY